MQLSSMDFNGLQLSSMVFNLVNTFRLSVGKETPPGGESSINQSVVHICMHMHMCDRTCTAGVWDRGACVGVRVCSAGGGCSARIETLRVVAL